MAVTTTLKNKQQRDNTNNDIMKHTYNTYTNNDGDISNDAKLIVLFTVTSQSTTTASTTPTTSTTTLRTIALAITVIYKTQMLSVPTTKKCN